MGSATVTISTAAKWLGVAKNTAYEAARSGELAGVPVISVGRRLLIPRAMLEEALGITNTSTDDNETSDAET